MADRIVVAEFRFVANKSFAGGNHPITVPTRYHQGLKESGLTDSARAKISFRKEPVIEGNIRSGWRAGGRYYQITLSNSKMTEAMVVPIGTTLVVRVLKSLQDWLVEIA